MSIRLALLLSLVATQPWCWCGAQGPPRPPEAAPRRPTAPEAPEDTALQPTPDTVAPEDTAPGATADH